MEEIEIKFLVRDSKTITEKLRKLGFRIAVGRHREKNYLLDDASGSLQKQDKLLRVRKTPSAQTITYKGPISTASKMKHREEVETRIDDYFASGPARVDARDLRLEPRPFARRARLPRARRRD